MEMLGDLKGGGEPETANAIFRDALDSDSEDGERDLLLLQHVPNAAHNDEHHDRDRDEQPRVVRAHDTLAVDAIVVLLFFARGGLAIGLVALRLVAACVAALAPVSYSALVVAQAGLGWVARIEFPALVAVLAAGRAVAATGRRKPSTTERVWVSEQLVAKVAYLRDGFGGVQLSRGLTRVTHRARGTGHAILVVARERRAIHGPVDVDVFCNERCVRRARLE